MPNKKRPNTNKNKAKFNSQFIKNMAKSFKYGVVDAYFKEALPDVTETFESNIQALQDKLDETGVSNLTAENVKEMLKKTSSQVKDAAKETRRNVLEDIKSGKWFGNEERSGKVIQDDMMKMFEDDDFMEDSFDLDGDYTDSFSESSGDVDFNIENNNTTNLTDNRTNVNNITRVSNNVDGKVLASVTQQMVGSISVVSSQLKQVSEFHINETKKYYDTSIALLTDISNTLKDVYTIQVPSTKGNSILNDIFDSAGHIDLFAYGKALGGGMSEMIFDEDNQSMIKMMVQTAIADPMKAVSMGILHVIPEKITEEFGKINDEFIKTTKNIVMELSEGKKGRGGWLQKLLGGMFGLDLSAKSTPKFQNKVVPYDAESKRALVNTIPGLLTKIYSAITNIPGVNGNGINLNSASSQDRELIQDPESPDRFITRGELANRNKSRQTGRDLAFGKNLRSGSKKLSKDEELSQYAALLDSANLTNEEKENLYRIKEAELNLREAQKNQKHRSWSERIKDAGTSAKNFINAEEDTSEIGQMRKKLEEARETNKKLTERASRKVNARETALNAEYSEFGDLIYQIFAEGGNYSVGKNKKKKQIISNTALRDIRSHEFDRRQSGQRSMVRYYDHTTGQEIDMDENADIETKLNAMAPEDRARLAKIYQELIKNNKAGSDDEKLGKYSLKDTWKNSKDKATEKYGGKGPIQALKRVATTFTGFMTESLTHGLKSIRKGISNLMFGNEEGLLGKLNDIGKNSNNKFVKFLFKPFTKIYDKQQKAAEKQLEEQTETRKVVESLLNVGQSEDCFHIRPGKGEDSIGAWAKAIAAGFRDFFTNKENKEARENMADTIADGQAAAEENREKGKGRFAKLKDSIKSKFITEKMKKDGFTTDDKLTKLIHYRIKEFLDPHIDKAKSKFHEKFDPFKERTKSAIKDKLIGDEDWDKNESVLKLAGRRAKKTVKGAYDKSKKSGLIHTVSNDFIGYLKENKFVEKWQEITTTMIDEMRHISRKIIKTLLDFTKAYYKKLFGGVKLIFDKLMGGTKIGQKTKSFAREMGERFMGVTNFFNKRKEEVQKLQFQRIGGKLSVDGKMDWSSLNDDQIAEMKSKYKGLYRSARKDGASFISEDAKATTSVFREQFGGLRDDIQNFVIPTIKSTGQEIANSFREIYSGKKTGKGPKSSESQIKEKKDAKEKAKDKSVLEQVADSTKRSADQGEKSEKLKSNRFKKILSYVTLGLLLFQGGFKTVSTVLKVAVTGIKVLVKAVKFGIKLLSVPLKIIGKVLTLPVFGKLVTSGLLFTTIYAWTANKVRNTVNNVKGAIATIRNGKADLFGGKVYNADGSVKEEKEGIITKGAKALGNFIDKKEKNKYDKIMTQGMAYARGLGFAEGTNEFTKATYSYVEQNYQEGMLSKAKSTLTGGIDSWKSALNKGANKIGEFINKQEEKRYQAAMTEAMMLAEKQGLKEGTPEYTKAVYSYMEMHYKEGILSKAKSKFGDIRNSVAKLANKGMDRIKSLFEKPDMQKVMNEALNLCKQNGLDPNSPEGMKFIHNYIESNSGNKIQNAFSKVKDKVKDKIDQMRIQAQEKLNSEEFKAQKQRLMEQIKGVFKREKMAMVWEKIKEKKDALIEGAKNAIGVVGRGLKSVMEVLSALPLAGKIAAAAAGAAGLVGLIALVKKAMSSANSDKPEKVNGGSDILAKAKNNKAIKKAEKEQKKASALKKKKEKIEAVINDENFEKFNIVKKAYWNFQAKKYGVTRKNTGSNIKDTRNSYFGNEEKKPSLLDKVKGFASNAFAMSPAGQLISSVKSIAGGNSLFDTMKGNFQENIANSPLARITGVIRGEKHELGEEKNGLIWNGSRWLSKAKLTPGTKIGNAVWNGEKLVSNSFESEKQDKESWWQKLMSIGLVGEELDFKKNKPSSLGAKLKGFIDSVWGGIKSAFAGAASAVGGGLASAGSAVANGFQQVGNFIGGGLQAAGNAITGFFGGGSTTGGGQAGTAADGSFVSYNEQGAGNTYSDSGAAIWDYLKNKGFSDVAIAGIMGNLYNESRLDPGCLECGYLYKNLDAAQITASNAALDQYTLDKVFPAYARSGISISKSGYMNSEDGHYYPGVGLAQWTGVRAKRLMDYAKSKGKPMSDLGVQLDFMLQEFEQRGDINKIKNAQTVEEASNAMYTNFEMPGASTTSKTAAKRRGYSQDVFAKYGNNQYQSMATGQVNDPTMASTAGSASSSGVINSTMATMSNDGPTGLSGTTATTGNSGLNSSNAVPAGAMIFGNSKSAPKWGHVGISDGQGGLYDNVGSIKHRSLADWSKNYNAVGWSYLGTNPNEQQQRDIVNAAKACFDSGNTIAPIGKQGYCMGWTADIYKKVLGVRPCKEGALQTWRAWPENNVFPEGTTIGTDSSTGAASLGKINYTNPESMTGLATPSPDMSSSASSNSGYSTANSMSNNTMNATPMASTGKIRSDAGYTPKTKLGRLVKSAKDAASGVISGFTGAVSNVASNISNAFTGGSATGGTSLQKKLVDTMASKHNQLRYSLKGGEQDPDKGVASCASTVAWAYKNAAGIKGLSAGSTTQHKQFPELFDTIYVNNGSPINESMLQPGDILYENWDTTKYNGKLHHTEMYAGDGKILSHGGAKNKNYPNGNGVQWTTLSDYRKKHLMYVRRLKNVNSSANNTETSNSATTSSGTTMADTSNSSYTSNDITGSTATNVGYTNLTSSATTGYTSAMDTSSYNSTSNYQEIINTINNLANILNTISNYESQTAQNTAKLASGEVNFANNSNNINEQTNNNETNNGNNQQNPTANFFNPMSGFGSIKSQRNFTGTGINKYYSRFLKPSTIRIAQGN